MRSDGLQGFNRDGGSTSNDIWVFKPMSSPAVFTRAPPPEPQGREASTSIRASTLAPLGVNHVLPSADISPQEIQGHASGQYRWLKSRRQLSVLKR